MVPPIVDPLGRVDAATWPSGAAMLIDPAINVTLSSGAFASIGDASGNGNNVSQGTGAFRPSVGTLNGQPAIVLGGTHRLDTGAISISLPATFLIVAVQTSAAANATLIDNPTGTTGRMVIYTPSAGNVVAEPTHASVSGNSFALDMTAARTLLITVASGSRVVRSNGAAVSTLACQASYTWTGYRLGAHVSGAFGWTGKLAFFGVWPRVMSAAEIAQAEAWARARWGTW
jgi:hypothetical protein